MEISGDTYLLISLMFAVFAAVAAVGTSVVLGAGFERLRAGFEIIRKQTGFFADAIHKLDQKAKELDEETGKIKENVSGLSEKVERVEKTTGFFSNAIQSLEQQISATGQKPMNQNRSVEPAPPRPQDYFVEEPELEKPEHNQITASAEEELSPDIKSLLGHIHFVSDTANTDKPEETARPQPQPQRSGGAFSKLLMDYFRSENRINPEEVTYH